MIDGAKCIVKIKPVGIDTLYKASQFVALNIGKNTTEISHGTVIDGDRGRIFE